LESSTMWHELYAEQGVWIEELSFGMCKT